MVGHWPRLAATARLRSGTGKPVRRRRRRDPALGRPNGRRIGDASRASGSGDFRGVLVRWPHPGFGQRRQDRHDVGVGRDRSGEARYRSRLGSERIQVGQPVGQRADGAGIAPPGMLARSVLGRWLYRAGYRQPPAPAVFLITAVFAAALGFSIDVVMLDRKGAILAIHRNVRPWRMLVGSPGTQAVLETTEGMLPDDLHSPPPSGARPDGQWWLRRNLPVAGG